MTSTAQLQQQPPQSPHHASTTTPPLTAASLSGPLSPSTPPSLAALSVPSSPQSVPAASTPSSSASLRSLSPSTGSGREGAGEEKVAESGAKQWQASVDDAGLRITLRTANPRSTPAKRPPPTPTSSGDDSEPEPLIDMDSQPSASLSSSSTSSTSTSPAPSSSKKPRTAASASSRRLPWTATELSALIQGVGRYGKDWLGIMRDERLGRLLRRRTVVACRKQFMFGRAMGQWRKGTRRLPGVDRVGQGGEAEAGHEAETEMEADAERKVEDGKSEAEQEETEKKEDAQPQSERQESAGLEQFYHATRARTRSATVQPKQPDEEQKDDASASDDDSHADIDMTSDAEATTTKSSRDEPWSNVRADELPPGKRRSEYRRCRHTCGCKGRTSDDQRAVVNKHGRRNHEKSESQHPSCNRHYGCHRLFGNLKQADEEEPQEAHDGDSDELSEQDDSDEDENEKSEELGRGLAAVAMQEEDVRPMFGPSLPLPAAPQLYRPSSVLAQSRAASTSSLHSPALYTSTTAPAGTRMAAVQSLLDLGPSATQQRQVSAARATEWTRWKDDSDRHRREDMIRALRLQVAGLVERDRGWQAKEAGWEKEKQELKARIKQLEAAVRQLKRSAAKSRRNSRTNDTDVVFATSTTQPSPMLMPTYPAIPIQSSSPRLGGEPAQLYHSPSSAFAAVGRGQQPVGPLQLPPARPLGPPYWPPAPLPSAQLFPQAPYPLLVPWGSPYPPPHAPFRVGQQQHPQHSPIYASAGMTGQGFPSPMTTLSLAAQPGQPAAQPSPVALAPLHASAAGAEGATGATATGTAEPAMPAITLSSVAVAREEQGSNGQHPALSANELNGHGLGHNAREA